MADDFKLQENTDGEYQCHSLATGEYTTIPTTFGEFLSCVKNPEDITNLFKKLQLTVICYINDGHSGAGIYNYYSNIKTMMELTEGSISFSPDNFAYQHVFIVKRNEGDLLSSPLTLVVAKPKHKPIIVDNIEVDLDVINAIATDIPPY